MNRLRTYPQAQRRQKNFLLAAISLFATMTTPMLSAEPRNPALAPELRVVGQGWNTDSNTVKRVLDSTTRAFWENLPHLQIGGPIIVHPRGGPITLLRRGPDGEIFIHLDTGDTYWSQYVFQMSHELCHVATLANNDSHADNWFEESVCEVASLYTLRKLSAVWHRNPPYPHWRDYAPRLAEYAHDRMLIRQIADDVTLADWVDDHRMQLQQNSPLRRDLFIAVANRLLPLFEQHPYHWASIQYLPTISDDDQTLERYFQIWYSNSSAQHRAFIRELVSLFGVTLEVY